MSQSDKAHPISLYVHASVPSMPMAGTRRKWIVWKIINGINSTQTAESKVPGSHEWAKRENSSEMYERQKKECVYKKNTNKKLKMIIHQRTENVCVRIYSSI